MRFFGIFDQVQGQAPEACWIRICRNYRHYGKALFFCLPLFVIQERVYIIHEDRFHDYWWTVPYFNIRWREGEFTVNYGMMPLKEVFVAKREFNIFNDCWEVKE